MNKELKRVVVLVSELNSLGGKYKKMLENSQIENGKLLIYFALRPKKNLNFQHFDVFVLYTFDTYCNNIL